MGIDEHIAGIEAKIANLQTELGEIKKKRDIVAVPSVIGQVTTFSSMLQKKGNHYWLKLYGQDPAQQSCISEQGASFNVIHELVNEIVRLRRQVAEG